MSNNLDQFDRQLKEVIENYQPEYSPKAWDKLNKNLGKGYSKWYYVAASVLLVAASAITYLFTQSNTNTNTNTTITTPTTLTENIVVKKNNTEISKSEVISKDEALKKQKKQTVSTNNTPKIEPNSQKTQVIVDTKKNNTSIPKIDSDEPRKMDQAQAGQSATPSSSVGNSIHSKIILSAKEGCEPLVENFSISALPADAQVKWSIEDKVISELKTFKYSFKEHGKYTVKLNISTSTEDYSVEEEIRVKIAPVADFSYQEDDGVLALENVSKDADFVQWNFPGVKTEEENPNFEMLYSDQYPVTLTVENQDGCKDSKSKLITYKVNHHIFAPTAFSPDGDGINDEFLVKYEPKEGYQYTLQIYNASGKKLFETQDQNIGWDGRNASSNSNINYEKYTWRLIIIDPRGRQDIKESTFKILKH